MTRQAAQQDALRIQSQRMHDNYQRQNGANPDGSDDVYHPMVLAQSRQTINQQNPDLVRQAAGAFALAPDDPAARPAQQAQQQLEQLAREHAAQRGGSVTFTPAMRRGEVAFSNSDFPFMKWQQQANQPLNPATWPRPCSTLKTTSIRPCAAGFTPDQQDMPQGVKAKDYNPGNPDHVSAVRNNMLSRRQTQLQNMFNNQQGGPQGAGRNNAVIDNYSATYQPLIDRLPGDQQQRYRQALGDYQNLMEAAESGPLPLRLRTCCNRRGHSCSHCSRPRERRRGMLKRDSLRTGIPTPVLSGRL